MMRDWMKTLPMRRPDCINDRSCVWFNEMLIQRNYKFMYAEQLGIIEGIIYFIDAVTGQQTNLAAEWVQGAYKRWLNEQVEKLLLGGRSHHVGDT